jgi:putative transposase
MDCLIPLLYLKGISTNDIPEALEPLLGPGAKGLSPANISKLAEGWHDEYQKWKGRSLEAKEYVYIWADGIYFNIRLSKDRPCLLVLVGSLPDGTKEVVGFLDGERESKLSWATLLLGLKKRGLAKAPKLAVGDGALGFWSALEEVFPGTRHQRCWVHKTANLLDKMPKKQQAQAKGLIHEIYHSATRKDAEEAFDHFLGLYQAKYPGTCQCLAKDRDQLLAFYDFPAEHWVHLRTTNPIESTFATVRHRHRQTKGNGSRKATLSMVFKLLMGAEKHWRRLSGYRLLDKVIRGVIFIDGIEKEKVAKEQAA